MGWFRALFHRRDRERHLDSELRFHLDLQVEEKISAGMAPEQARREAAIEFGGMELIKEECRDERASVWFEQLAKDFLVSLRSLRRSPVFSATVIVTLAVCLGANISIFSVLYGLILKPLPFHGSDRLVEAYNSQDRWGFTKLPVSYLQYLDFKENADDFEGFAFWKPWTFTIGEDSVPTRGAGASITSDFFPLLDVQPLMGRFFTAENSMPGKDHVVVLTRSFWETYYGSDPAIIGKIVRISGEPFTIIGVAPAEIEAIRADAAILRPFVWAPNKARPPDRWSLTNAGILYGQLKGGVSLSKGEIQLMTLEQRFYEHVDPEIRYHVKESGWRTRIGAVRDQQTGSLKTSLSLLQAGVLFVLLLGCVNVANLMLARAFSRRPELAVRQALGASRWVLARQILVESMLLASAGVALGLALAWTSLRVMNTYITRIVPSVQEISLNGPIVILCTVSSLVVALLIGLLPIMWIWRANLQGAIHLRSRQSSAGRGVRAARSLLVTAQVAIALVLLVGAGLLIESFARVLAVNPGFNAREILHVRVAMPQTYLGTSKVGSTENQILAKMAEIPGVESISLSSNIPVNGYAKTYSTDSSTQFTLNSYPRRESPAGKPDELLNAFDLGISPEFFDTMGIRLIEGRKFTASDDARSPKVFIVDRAFAEKYFPGRSAVGQGFGRGGKNDHVIVGVAETAALNGLEARGGMPFVYRPLSQGGNWHTDISVELRTTRDTTDILPLVRDKLREIDGTLPMYSVGTLQSKIDTLLSSRRGVMLLLGTYSLIALLLSAIGIYGMLAYDVALRTHEIGVRGAIGASRRQIMALILREGIWRTLNGLLIGLAGAFLLTRFMTSLLFEVRPADPMAYLAVSILLLLVATIAGYLPARRAANVDPAVALRAE